MITLIVIILIIIIVSNLCVNAWLGGTENLAVDGLLDKSFINRCIGDPFPSEGTVILGTHGHCDTIVVAVGKPIFPNTFILNMELAHTAESNDVDYREELEES